MLVEEVPKTSGANASTIYFSSSVNLTARLMGKDRYWHDESGEGPPNKKGRTKVNYNLNQLFNAQTQANNDAKINGPSKSARQIQLEKVVQKRLVELNQESSTKGFELPKNFAYTSIHSSRDNRNSSQKSRQGNTPSTKRILAARRNLNLYYEEERNLISINTILSSNFQFIDVIDSRDVKNKIPERSRPRVRLCCICGSKSNYSRCPLCGLYYCTVKCNKLHQELRCT